MRQGGTAFFTLRTTKYFQARQALDSACLAKS